MARLRLGRVVAGRAQGVLVRLRRPAFSPAPALDVSARGGRAPPSSCEPCRTARAPSCGPRGGARCRRCLPDGREPRLRLRTGRVGHAPRLARGPAARPERRRGMPFLGSCAQPRPRIHPGCVLAARRHLLLRLSSAAIAPRACRKGPQGAGSCCAGPPRGHLRLPRGIAGSTPLPPSPLSPLPSLAQRRCGFHVR